MKRSIFKPTPDSTYFKVTVTAVRSHADEVFRPGVVYRVRDDILEGIADIIATKEPV